jgi:hypothetical protein
MRSLQFNTDTREIVISNGITQTTNNPSIQNGVIIRDARCINVFLPILGVGFNPINSQSDSVVFELNRWKNQCLQDGAKEATYNIKMIGVFNVTSNIDYTIGYL